MKKTVKTINNLYDKAYCNTSLRCVYKSCSAAKWSAWDECTKIMHKYNGYDLRVLSHNTSIFTVAFEFVDKETGVVKLYYITPHYGYIVDRT